MSSILAALLLFLDPSDRITKSVGYHIDFLAESGGLSRMIHQEVVNESSKKDRQTRLPFVATTYFLQEFVKLLFFT